MGKNDLGGDKISIPIFLSYAKPFNRKQVKFIGRVEDHLKENGFTPRTLGVTDYSMSAPLVKIKNIMGECYGLLSIAFRRAYIEIGTGKLDANLAGENQYNISESWITSPYCQIEPSMAFQIDMPILIFRERGVIADGILEKGVVGSYMPEFDLNSSINRYFKSPEWKQLISDWKSVVLEYQKHKQFEVDDIIKHIVSCSICEEKEICPKELYRAFEKSINSDGINNYSRFTSIIGIDEKFESRYRIKYHSMESDYITICKQFF